MKATADTIRATANAGGFLPASVGFTSYIDLNGAAARRFLESAGFKVVSNRDTGRNGEAVTACGIVLSSNGYCHRATLGNKDAAFADLVTVQS